MNKENNKFIDQISKIYGKIATLQTKLTKLSKKSNRILQINRKLSKKVKKETMIFPRYHQLKAVRDLVSAAAIEGTGHNYLIEHSAGSGKSNTIGWLAHRLSSLHDAHDKRVFDSVIVVTDRLVLDQQLQNTI